MAEPFYWYHVNGDGTADAHPDTYAVRKRVDTEAGWYGSPEGAILHGGVRATAFERKTEMTYDGALWLRTGAMVEAGFVTTTKITAEAPNT